MSNEKIGLTEAEWYLMECLWEESPRTGRETVDYLSKHNGWSRSTTLTMLSRMTKKGLISCDDSGEMKIYSPLVERETAVIEETEDFLDRIYSGSLPLMVSAFTGKQNLSTEEINELYEILKKAEEANK